MSLLLFCVPFEGFFSDSGVFRLFREFFGKEGVLLGFVEVFSSVSGLGLEVIILCLSIKVRCMDIGTGFLGSEKSCLSEAHFNFWSCGSYTTRPKKNKHQRESDCFHESQLLRSNNEISATIFTP